MGLLRRAKIALDSDVNLLVAALEPAAASGPQGGWLFDLRHSQDLTVEFPSSRLAPLGRGNLDMIYAFDAWPHARKNITA